MNLQFTGVHHVRPKMLDLVAFPSLIWYQVGYSTHVLRQASARARRPIQSKPCIVFSRFTASRFRSRRCLFLAMDTIARDSPEVVVPMLNTLGYDGLGGTADAEFSRNAMHAKAVALINKARDGFKRFAAFAA